MPAWSKPPATLVALFTKATGRLTGVETRTMFGYPAVFAGGHMFAGLFQDRMVLRLPEAARVRFVSVYGAKPFEPVRGRVMREYVEVPAEVLRNPRLLAASLAKGRAYAAGLPPKPARRARPSAGRPSPRGHAKEGATGDPGTPEVFQQQALSSARRSTRASAPSDPAGRKSSRR